MALAPRPLQFTATDTGASLTTRPRHVAHSALRNVCALSDGEHLGVRAAVTGGRGRPAESSGRPVCSTTRHSAARRSGGVAAPAVGTDVNTVGFKTETLQEIQLRATPLTEEAFAPYGEIVRPSEDGEPYGAHDASLDLAQGTPRAYIMRLRDKPLTVSHITHHASVTQCLAAAGGGRQPWFLAVAPPSIAPAEGEGVLRSGAGHLYTPPPPEAVRVFEISGPTLVKLHAATWHAGPMFAAPEMDFFNLELSDTNVNDHTTHAFSDDGVVFRILS